MRATGLVLFLLTVGCNGAALGGASNNHDSVAAARDGQARGSVIGLSAPCNWDFAQPATSGAISEMWTSTHMVDQAKPWCSVQGASTKGGFSLTVVTDPSPLPTAAGGPLRRTMEFVFGTNEPLKPGQEQEYDHVHAGTGPGHGTSVSYLGRVETSFTGTMELVSDVPDYRLNVNLVSTADPAHNDSRPGFILIGTIYGHLSAGKCPGHPACAVNGDCCIIDGPWAQQCVDGRCYTQSDGYCDESSDCSPQQTCQLPPSTIAEPPGVHRLCYSVQN